MNLPILRIDVFAWFRRWRQWRDDRAHARAYGHAFVSRSAGGCPECESLATVRERLRVRGTAL